MENIIAEQLQRALLALIAPCGIGLVFGAFIDHVKFEQQTDQARIFEFFVEVVQEVVVETERGVKGIEGVGGDDVDEVVDCACGFYGYCLPLKPFDGVSEARSVDSGEVVGGARLAVRINRAE